MTTLRYSIDYLHSCAECSHAQPISEYTFKCSHLPLINHVLKHDIKVTSAMTCNEFGTKYIKKPM